MFLPPNQSAPGSSKQQEQKQYRHFQQQHAQNPNQDSTPTATASAAESYDDAYYRTLLNRVDAQLFLSHSGPGLVTFHGGRHEEEEGEVSEATAPPATLCAWILTSHTILGACWHLELENTFTRPLKIYFLLTSLLLVFFLSVKIRLATYFAEIVVIAVITNAFHYCQREAFFRFQSSLFLWPFLAAALTFTLTVWDVVLVIKGGSEGLHHEVGVAIVTYIFGFLSPEVFVRAIQWQGQRRPREEGARQDSAERGPGGAHFEEYSIL